MSLALDWEFSGADCALLVTKQVPNRHFVGVIEGVNKITFFLNGSKYIP